uniref:Uncharacterized protein n=1 Tax=Timema cristinae TaxID=61476 RepID=A0A7R9GRM6_TIMCR|nr:unnamed protein product [Timema cristinae]
MKSRLTVQQSKVRKKSQPLLSPEQKTQNKKPVIKNYDITAEKYILHKESKNNSSSVEGGKRVLKSCLDEARFIHKMGYKYGYKVLINTMMVSILCRKGTSFHESRGNTYSPPYGEGDVLGFLIILPESENISPIPPTYKDRPLVKFKSHLYYEEKDNVAEALKNLNVLPGSKIIFFTNGQCHGAAFSDIYGGAYYPTLSLYKNATDKIFLRVPSNCENLVM